MSVVLANAARKFLAAHCVAAGKPGRADAYRVGENDDQPEFAATMSLLAVIGMRYGLAADGWLPDADDPRMVEWAALLDKAGLI